MVDHVAGVALTATTTTFTTITDEERAHGASGRRHSDVDLA